MSLALKQQFVSEAREQLEQIAKDVMTLEKAGASVGVFDSLFRQVHTLKGNSGLFDELLLVGRTLHHAEDQLDKLRENLNAGALPEQLADLLLELLDFIEEFVSRFESDDEGLQSDESLQRTSLRLIDGFKGLAEKKLSQVEGDLMAEALIHADSDGEGSLPVWVNKHLSAMQGLTGDVVWVRYKSCEQAFFRGEDPLLNVLKLPGLVWSKADLPAPDNDDMVDPFACRVELLALSTAERSDIEEALKYVLDCCEIYPLSVASFQQSQLGESTQKIEQSESNRVGQLLNPAIRKQAHSLWAAQIQSLKTQHARQQVPEVIERHRAVVSTVLINLARSLGMNHWVAQIESAFQDQSFEQTIERLTKLSAELQDKPLNQDSNDALDAACEPPASQTHPAALAIAGDCASNRVGNSRAREVLRVPRERVDRFMDLVGEMVVAKNSLPFLAARAEDEFGSREIARLIREQFAVVNRIVDEMQDAVMRVRMTPVDAVFQRFPRLVRDLSRQLGKHVELRIRGEETEADKNMIERLAEPMIHLVRNTLDHGIETPAVRVKSGKLPEGLLEITATQDGDRVLIELMDDGAGINRDKVSAKALEKGLVTADKLSQMRPEDIDQLIFAPGFSTADQISAVSGRGVGMDAVRTSIESMGGDLRLCNQPGQGLKVSISLPLSMAVSRVMVIESGGQQFGVPVDTIAETVRRPGSEFKKMQGAKALILRNKLIPLRELNAELETGEQQRPNDEGEWAILICRVRGQRVGLIIDDFKGTADLIVKPMDGALSGLSHFQGTALMGDGSVLLVLDLMEVFAREHCV